MLELNVYKKQPHTSGSTMSCSWLTPARESQSIPSSTTPVNKLPTHFRHQCILYFTRVCTGRLLHDPMSCCLTGQTKHKQIPKVFW